MAAYTVPDTHCLIRQTSVPTGSFIR